MIFFESDLTAKDFLEGRYSSTGRSTDSPKRDGTNKKMSPEVYKLRRIVMNYIYEAKKLLNGNMDRVEIRIVDLSPENIRQGTLGYAFMGDHIVWISEHILTDKKFKPFLKEIVFHELLHANYNIGHNKINMLMSPYMPKIPTPSIEVDREFLEQIERAKRG